jgi:tetratricopeptide (TPR) repeat protein
MHKILFIPTLLLLPLLLLLTGCGQKQGPEPTETAQAPSSAPEAPPMNAPFMQNQVGGAVEEGKVRPLKLKGLNSVEELNRGLAKLSDVESKGLFEDAFRMTFTIEQSSRNYAQAETKFKRVLEKNSGSVESYRGLGYAMFNQGQSDASLQYYLKAVEIDPNYGEAHYALALMYAMQDLDKGRKHFQKAMQLGVPDERKLGEKFYR